MKNIKKILYTFCTLMIVSACVDDDKLFELDDFPTGALPNMARTTNDLGFIDSFNFATTPIEFTIDFTNNFEQSEDGGLTSGGSGKETTDTEFKEVTSVDLHVSYSSIVTGTTEEGFLQNISAWPATVSYTGVDDLVAAIASLNSSADISVGDVFTFVCGINFADGTTLPAFVADAAGNMLPNYSVNFAGGGNNPGYDFSIAHNVSCSSDLADATVYDVTTNVTGTCCGLPTGNIAGGNTATVTEIGVGQYAISDFLNFYFAPFTGPGADEEIFVIDVCNSISVDAVNCSATSFLCYGPNSTDPTGSYDPVTGIWVIKWEDAFGNGIRGVTTLTPQ
ncbi:MAG: hypothetical protein JXR07_17475 [Reichenbachiella sp.]